MKSASGPGGWGRVRCWLSIGCVLAGAGCGGQDQATADAAPSADARSAVDVALDAPLGSSDAPAVDAFAFDTLALDAFAEATCTGTDERACGNRTLYCAHPEADPCGDVEPAGVCRPRPTREECGVTSEIVCGCDGRSYESACGARRWGVEARSAGACPGTTTYACGDGHRCELGVEYCVAETYMSGASSFDTIFYCRELPAACAMSPTCASCFADESCEDRDPPGAMVVSRST